MNRNVVNAMDMIFNRLIDFIADENRDRISKGTKRHIKAYGKGDEVFELVKGAIVLSEDPKIPICGILFDEKKYLVVTTLYAEVLESISTDVVMREENPELFQGLGMLAMAYNYLPLKQGISSEKILDECLAFDEQDKEFSFFDIAEFFEDYIVFDISESVFDLRYCEDFNRLNAISLSRISKFYNEVAQSHLKELLLLESSRSVAATILNSLYSEQWEYSYLQMYQCLEYLFAVQNALGVKDKYGADLYISVDIFTDNILRKNEKDSLIGVLNYADKMIKQQFITTVFSEDIDEDKITEKIAKTIYDIRCNVAHLRFNQPKFEYPVDKISFMQEFILLILNIFQNLNGTIVDICLHKSTWTPLNPN